MLSRVHWVRPELVAEVKYLTWTDDNLLRQVVYEGMREDKPAAEVRRPPLLDGLPYRRLHHFLILNRRVFTAASDFAILTCRPGAWLRLYHLFC